MLRIPRQAIWTFLKAKVWMSTLFMSIVNIPPRIARLIDPGTPGRNINHIGSVSIRAHQLWRSSFLRFAGVLISIRSSRLTYKNNSNLVSQFFGVGQPDESLNGGASVCDVPGAQF